MSNSGTRVKELRINLKLTQEEFGSKIGLKKNSLSQIENGKNALTQQNIVAICKTWNVNEYWLRTGEGEMFAEVSRDDELLSLIEESMTEESGEFKRRLALAIMKLNSDQIKACREWILDNIDIFDADSRENEIDRKVEEYRAELEAQAAFSKLEASQTGNEDTGSHKAI